MRFMVRQMSRGRHRFLCAVASCFVLAACRQPEQRLNTASGEDAIRAQLAANVAATNRRDAAAVAATFTDDADMLLPGQPRISGIEAIRRNEETFYRMPFSEWNLSVDRVRFLTPDVAIVDTRSRTVIGRDTMQSNDVLVMFRRDAKWRIAAVRAGLRR